VQSSLVVVPAACTAVGEDRPEQRRRMRRVFLIFLNLITPPKSVATSLSSNYDLRKVNTTVCETDFAYLPEAALVAVTEHVEATFATIVAVPFAFVVMEQVLSFFA